MNNMTLEEFSVFKSIIHQIKSEKSSKKQKVKAKEILMISKQFLKIGDELV